MKNILIVDDDLHIGNMLEETLIKEGYGVLRAFSGTEALLLLSGESADLILLDLMLPGLNGEEVLPKIKAIPTIIVSAKTDVDNKISLLLGGAVDYVTKPFNTKELLARIDIHLRSGNVNENSNILKYDDITLNVDTRHVAIGENEIKLTKTEFAILKTLMLNPTQVITKSLILDRISEDTLDCTENSLKIHVSNLRKKLRGNHDKEYIEAVWGIGFKMKS